ncbi:MAG: class I SAM-dependent methyltransferase [Acidobacteriota bacterium]
MRSEVGFLIRGLLAYLPWYHRRLLRRARTGGTDSARYCYSVWLRHLTKLGQNGWSGAVESVAELGPGDSIGVGLAALLCGARRYVALDIFPYSERARWLRILDELVPLFENRAPIPDETELPAVWPRLESYAYPEAYLPSVDVEPSRIARLREEISGPHSTTIRYICPWFEAAQVERDSVDLILSQAVMEHVTDLDAAYRAMWAWLRPGGFCSHVVDLRSHGVSDAWNGHWRYPEALWRFAVARREFTMNRMPLSAHLGCIERAGLQVVHCEVDVRRDGLPRKALARAFRGLSEEDLSTSGVHLILRKP